MVAQGAGSYQTCTKALGLGEGRSYPDKIGRLRGGFTRTREHQTK